MTKSGEISITVIATGFPAGMLVEGTEVIKIEPKTVGSAVRQSIVSKEDSNSMAAPVAPARSMPAQKAPIKAVAPVVATKAEDAEADVPDFLARLRRRK